MVSAMQPGGRGGGWPAASSKAALRAFTKGVLQGVGDKLHEYADSNASAASEQRRSWEGY